MIQLKYDDNFNKIVEDIPLLTDDEIPSFIHDFIDDKFNKKIIFDEKHSKYYCACCYSELNNYYCSKCHRKYKNNYYDTINVDNIDDEISKENSYTYYFFDVIGKEPLLYEIKETIYLYKTIHLTLVRRKKVNNVYLITDEYMLNLFTKKIFNYNYCKEELARMNKEFEVYNLEDELDDLDNNILNIFYNYESYLYTDNLKELKNTIYKYTHIWEAEEYLKETNVSLDDIVILPLTSKSFEYLIKHKLFQLAFSLNVIEDNLDIKNIRKLVRKYLDFMVNNNINYSELMLLNYTNCNDINFLKEYADYYYIIKDIYANKIDFFKVIDYFKKKKYKKTKLFEYNDYINICKELGFNLKDKDVLFPKNLIREHDRIVSEYQVVKDPEIDKKIKKISNILNINKYEDDSYVIYPAPTLDSMIDEGSMQNNCLRTYCQNYASGKTNIYFMRDKRKLNKSLVTIEVINNKVVQAKIKNNELPDNSLMNIINKWERALIPIDFSK